MNAFNLSHDEAYQALKDYGHSAFKAAEILLDAQRGDMFSQKYVAFICARDRDGTAKRRQTEICRSLRTAKPGGVANRPNNPTVSVP